MRKISIEYPEYVFCPLCKEKINLDYNVKHYPKTNDIIHVLFELPVLLKLDHRKEKNYMYGLGGMKICNHCKGILGF
ncbi:MAG: hypothetical protein V3V33_06745 [Candidatus Lokiarchaeia archaeon]